MNLENNYFLRKIDELGRVVLPLEIRRELDIKDAETIKISLDDGKIIIEKLRI
ncbi:MAG: AbrB/MazE/SpoVT family DNA-binding domain-containing protein [Clostridia bacterium]|nr:AbrB/MazE/SpoVT family DNA-binding domain-containing protein [Clostridia bacterium]